jgi:hypothetical protein
VGKVDILRHLNHVSGSVKLFLERRKLTQEELLLCSSETRKDVVAGTTIQSTAVEHRRSGAMGCVLTMADGQRLAFSEDRLSDGKFEHAVDHCHGDG